MNEFTISIAGPDDVPSLVNLINSAYRGEASKTGWTTEADLLEGDLRTDNDDLIRELSAPGAVMIACQQGPAGPILGCVYLQKRNEKLYLGMLSVSPASQAKGVGKQLLQAASEHARQVGCDKIIMTVISVRQELISWYERNGYKKTGEKKPFPVDHRFGIPSQPLEFLVLEKDIPA